MRSIGITNYLDSLGFDYMSHKDEIIRIGDETAIRKDRNGKPYRKNYERGLLLCALCNHFGLKKFLEFGTGRGYTCACLIQLSKMENITTVDHKSSLEAKHLIRSLGLDDSIVHYKSLDTNSLKESDIPGKFDLFFIDAQHDGKSVKVNYEFARLKSQQKSVIVFDDYRNKFPSVKKSIDQMGFKYKTLVHTDGWIIPNICISTAHDADKVVDGKEYGSGLVICSDEIPV